MTPERDDGGRSPRREKAESAFRLEKAGRESIEPERRSVPSWKRAAVKLQKEQAAPAEPRGDTEALPQTDTPGLDRSMDDEQEQRAVEPEAPRQEASETGAPTKSNDFVGRGGARERTQFSPQGGNGNERTLRRRVPKYRQHSRRDYAEATPDNQKFRQSSSQPLPAEKLHRGGAGTSADQPEPDKLRKARQRMEQREGKLNTARGKLEKQKPYKEPGPVKQVAGYAGRSVHSYVRGKVYENEHENVGVEGAHRVELAGEAVERKTLRFAKQRIRTHPARTVRNAEGRYRKAAGNLQFQRAAAEHPELKKNAISRLWWKRQQKKRYQKQAREAAKQSARAAEKTAVTAEKAGRAVVGFIKRHPLGCAIALCCVLLLMVMQSCTSSLAAIGNGVTGSVAATTYPAEDADMLGAEAAYAGLEADLQARLDNYEATHGYDEYAFELDDIGHDPYVLMSILSALHVDGWTLADVQGDLQSLFDRQYIFTETVTVETRYRTETQTDDEGNETEVEVPYDYYICTVTLDNFNLSHVPVYIMGEDQLSRYSLYMAALGNRPDLFPGSAYIGRYGGPVTRYDIPPEALEDEVFAAMIKEAEKYLGYPYVWGGSSPATSFDCSGFVSWVVNHCGMGWDFGRCGSDALYFSVCTPIAPSEAKPGDLIFFQKTYDTPNTSHVGIYVGGGMMIHCGDPIQYTSINTSYWQAHFYGFGRLPSVR